MQPPIHTLQDLYDSNGDFFITLREYKPRDKLYVCMCGLDYMVRSGHVLCYHDREQHLRRDDHRRQGIAETEDIARYGHQGGGQRQAGQVPVI